MEIFKIDLEKVELIFILAGSKSLRHKIAINLLKVSPKSLITVSGENEVIDQNEITKGRIISCEDTKSTFEDAIALKSLAIKKKLNNIVLVTSKSHVYRTRLTFNKVLKSSTISFKIIYTQDVKSSGTKEYFHYFIRYVEEYLKVLYYFMKGRI